MLRISEAAKLGLHATALIARSDRRLSVRELAERLCVSRSHLAKVMQRLVGAGVVDSVRGAGGGFCLAKSAHSLTLLEIWEALDGEMSVSRCLFESPVCAKGECRVGELLASVASLVRERVGGITVGDFVTDWDCP